MSKTGTIQLPPTISIGGGYKDVELVAKILKYKEEKGFAHSSDAVRALCEYALDFKDISKKL